MTPGVAKQDLPRTLGLLDATVVVVGIVIGAGIFLVPNLVARNLPSATLILTVWIFSGVLSFFGALAYAELGAMLPYTGGQYIYLREAFGPLSAFLSGWTISIVMLSSAIAWLAVSFSIYLAQFVPLSKPMAKAIAIGLIAILTTINYRGVKAGVAVQRTFTGLKLAGIAVLVMGAFLAGGHAASPAMPLPSPFPWSHFGVAMISCLLCYDGWASISFLAGEVKRPDRNLPLALALGLGICACVYTLANVAYLHVLTVPEIAGADAVGAAAAHKAFGALGGGLVSLIILVSVVGASNGQLLTAPRILFAQAGDGLFFRSFRRIHSRYQTPSFSILAQGIWSGLLALTGSYEALMTYAMFAAWVVYGATVTSVLVLRHKYPDARRPYRMWGYPVTTLAFIAVALWFVGNTIVNQPGASLLGALLIGAGIPVYYVWRHRSSDGQLTGMAQGISDPRKHDLHD
jgi:APA family basic amino acid/polyamine antiporter